LVTLSVQYPVASARPNQAIDEVVLGGKFETPLEAQRRPRMNVDQWLNANPIERRAQLIRPHIVFLG
jgi:hypothetical protein